MAQDPNPNNDGPKQAIDSLVVNYFEDQKIEEQKKNTQNIAATIKKVIQELPTKRDKNRSK